MKYTIILSIGLMLFATGCYTRRPVIQRTNNPALNNAISQNDEQISRLTFQFNQIKESNKNCVDHINRLNKEIALLQRKIITLEKSNKLLNDELNAEKTARQNDIEKLLREVAKQTAEAMNASKFQNTKKTSQKGPAGKGEFYEYTVEAGATLGAIARAYKVSLSDIKKANNLQSDVIRIGQKLYIPKK